jgi:hypothetical protein
MGKPDLGTITLISLSVESFILANVFWLFALSTRLSVKRVIATKHSVGCGGSLARLYFREPFHAAIAILLSFSVVVSRISHICGLLRFISLCSTGSSLLLVSFLHSGMPLRVRTAT